MYKEDLYQGGVASTIPVDAVPVGRDVISKPLADGMMRVAAAADKAMMTGVALEDGRHEFEAKRELMALEREARENMERRLHLPDGHSEALFDKNGNLRKVELENMRAGIAKRLAGVGAQILDPVRRQEVQASAELAGMRLLDGMAETWNKVQRQKVESSWRDAYDLALAEGRHGDAVGMLPRGVELKLFSPERAKLMNLQILKRQKKEQLEGQRAAGLEGAEAALDALIVDAAGGVAAPAVSAAGGGVAAPAGMVAVGKELTLDAGLMGEAGEKAADLTLDGKRMGVLGERGQLKGPVAGGLAGDGLSVQGEQVEVQQAVYEPVWTLEEAQLKGIGGVLSPAEFEAQLGATVAACMAVEGKPAVKTGRMEWQAGIAAPEAAQVATLRANLHGGWNKADCQTAVYAIGAELLSNPAYDNLSDAEMRALLVKSVSVDGMGEQLFGAEAEPDLAYESFIGGMVDRLMSTRGDGEGLRGRVKDALAGTRGEVPVRMDRRYGTAIGLAHFVGVGQERVRLSTDDGAVDAWSVSEQGMADFCYARVAHKLGEYRLNGGENWYDEQDIIQNELNKAAKEYIQKGEAAAWLSFKAHKMRDDAFIKEKFEQDAKVWREKVKGANADVDALKKAEAAAKKKAADEKKAAEAAAKAAAKPKRPTKEELLKERPYLGELVCRYVFADNGVKRPTLTVPGAEYRKMLEQFECEERDLLYASLGGQELLVVPGDGWTVNRAALTRMAVKNNKLNKAAAAAIMAGTDSKLKLRRYRTVGK
jgi:hypothetical protein